MTDEPSGLSGIWEDRQLPKSCIESTCHAMQCIGQITWYPWEDAETTTNGPGVWAAFGNKFICISRVSDLPDVLTGVTDFSPSYLGGASFAAVMCVGRGLILANSKSSNQKFNMHLGAVIDSQDGIFTITDMSERGPVVNSKREYSKLKSTKLVKGFRGDDYGDPDVYKVGLLICETDTGFDGLRDTYSEEQTIDEPLPASSDSEA
jgi:hypothetical protein